MMLCKIEERWTGLLYVSYGACTLYDRCILKDTTVEKDFCHHYVWRCASVNSQMENKNTMIFMQFSPIFKRRFFWFITPITTQSSHTFLYIFQIVAASYDQIMHINVCFSFYCHIIHPQHYGRFFLFFPFLFIPSTVKPKVYL